MVDTQNEDKSEYKTTLHLLNEKETKTFKETT